MPCLCQYLATNLALRVEDSLNVTDSKNEGSEKGYLKDLSTGEVTASELVACKAQILSLKRDLSTANISAENMKNLTNMLIEKQNDLTIHVFALRKMNEDLRLQQVDDRNNQAMERTVLLKELHEIKMLLQNRTSVMEETLQQNWELTQALKDANEKIYGMGMKFLKLKSNRSSSRDGRSPSTISEPE